jgi:hypothetical protein
MPTIKETIYANRNNVIRLLLSEDDQLFHVAYPEVTPTRWVFTIHDDIPVVVDSAVTASAFDWDAETSILELKLGSLFSESLAYTWTSLVMYSAVWPLGIVWVNPTCSPDRLQVRVCTVS